MTYLSCCSGTSLGSRWRSKITYLMARKQGKKKECGSISHLKESPKEPKCFSLGPPPKGPTTSPPRNITLGIKPLHGLGVTFQVQGIEFCTWLPKFKSSSQWEVHLTHPREPHSHNCSSTAQKSKSTVSSKAQRKLSCEHL